MKRCVVLGAGLLILLAGVGQGQEKKAEVRVERDLVYGKGGDTDLQLDLAMPKDGDGPFPAIVCIHGGGWRGGNRQNLAKTIEVLAGRGYVAATISYRLVPKATFPAQIEDSKAAVRWLRANAKKYKVDPDHIGAVGYSAGGHLCCLLGVTSKGDRLEGKGGNAEQSSQVQAVVSFFGPTDFTERTWNATVEKDILAPFLGGAFEDKRDNYKKASPVSYVRKSAPPFLFFHGTEDKVVAVSQSRIMADKLRGVGASAKLVEIEGAGHGWGGEKLLETVEQMVKFFDTNLKKK
jgi:acetyl esterase/lipase